MVLEVPASNYWLSIREVREGKDAVYVLSRVGSRGGGAMVISELSQTVEGACATAGKRVQQVLLGKTWGWGDEAIISVEDEASLPPDFQSGKVLYTNPSPAGPVDD